MLFLGLAGTSTALIAASLAASAGLGAFQAVRQSDAQDEAEQQRDKLLRNRPRESEAARTAARANAVRRQRQRAAGAFGRSDTILTGPLGVPGTASTAGQGFNTLLGGGG